MKNYLIDRSPDKLHEECGVFGVYRNNEDIDIVSLTRDALYGLQHRGQESAGITVVHNEETYSVKDLGIVASVLTDKALERLPNGSMAVGHVRYKADDFLERAATQPLVMRYSYGSLALAHNGAVTNFAEIRDELEHGGAIFQSNSNAEVIGYLIATKRIETDTIEQAVLKTMESLKGAYSLVIGAPNKLIGVRDPHGFKPLCIGKLGNSIMISSESCAIESLGGEFIRDVEPGEVVVIDDEGFHSYICDKKEGTSICLFEYVYFARPDSVINGVSVNTSRRIAGRLLYEENPIKADIVCGVPDSGLDAAQGYSEASGITYATAFIKNKYIGRTSAVAGIEKSTKLLKTRLNVLKNIVKDKSVVIIDDSIVRGNTAAHIVRLLRNAGAKEVHMRISSPEFLYPCYFGIDLPKKEELISNIYTKEEIRKKIGADSLEFLSLDGLKKTAEGCTIGLCDGCFSGKYCADIPKTIFEDKFANKIHKI